MPDLAHHVGNLRARGEQKRDEGAPQRMRRDAFRQRVAPAAGVTSGTLSLIERGRSNPTWGTVKGIAAALGVTIADLAKLSLESESERL
jgi:DNA-binding XRE family transcriptional regulator